MLAGIAWIPIATLWFGYGFGAITFVIFNAVFFIVAYNTLLGVSTIPMPLRHAAASLGAGRWAMLTEVLLPGALPNIVTGIRTGLGFAWRGLIAAEMIATNVGLGYMLFVARDFYRTEVIVFGMIVIGVLWLLIDRLLLAPLERATIERWGMVRAHEPGRSQAWSLYARATGAGRRSRAIVPFIPVVALWWIVAAAGVFPRAFFPSPADVVRSFGDLVYKGILPDYLEDSVVRLAVGAAVGMAIGIPLGLLVGLSRKAHAALWPLAPVLPGDRRHRLAADPADLVRLRPRHHDLRDRLHGALPRRAQHRARRALGAGRPAPGGAVARRLARRASCGRWCCRARCRTSSPACATASATAGAR